MLGQRIANSPNHARQSSAPSRCSPTTMMSPRASGHHALGTSPLSRLEPRALALPASCAGDQSMVPSGDQQLIGGIDAPERLGVAAHVRVVELHEPPVGRLDGVTGGAPGELQDAEGLIPLPVRGWRSRLLGSLGSPAATTPRAGPRAPASLSRAATSAAAPAGRGPRPGRARRSPG